MITDRHGRPTENLKEREPKCKRNGDDDVELMGCSERWWDDGLIQGVSEKADGKIVWPQINNQIAWSEALVDCCLE